jgi:phage portal protein BeeE
VRLFHRQKKVEDRDLHPVEWPIYAPGIPLQVEPVTEATQYNALAISDAYAAIRVMADSVASLPWRVYRDTGNGRQAAGPDTRLVRLLQHPSPGSTSCDLFSSIMVHFNVTGNSFVGKFRDESGEIVELGLLPPDVVQVIKRGETITYQVSLPNQETTFFTPVDVLHIKAMCGLDIGLRGLSPVTQARLALTNNASLLFSSHQFFQNGSRPSGILNVKSPQSDFTIDQIRENWDTRHGSTLNKSAKQTPCKSNQLAEDCGNHNPRVGGWSPSSGIASPTRLLSSPQREQLAKRGDRSALRKHRRALRNRPGGCGRPDPGSLELQGFAHGVCVGSSGTGSGGGWTSVSAVVSSGAKRAMSSSSLTRWAPACSATATYAASWAVNPRAAQRATAAMSGSIRSKPRSISDFASAASFGLVQPHRRAATLTISSQSNGGATTRSSPASNCSRNTSAASTCRSPSL